MGFTFRKSFGKGPFRVNFSKSGISYSVGVKGARVNFSNRGTYVTIGGKGIYYRKKISLHPEHSYRYNPQPIPVSTIPHTITSAAIEELTDIDSQEFVKELTEKNAKISYFNWLGIFPCTIVSIFFMAFYFGNDEQLYFQHPISFWVLSTVFVVGFYFLLSWLRKIDVERLLIFIHYEIDNKVENIYNDLIVHFGELSKTSRRWQYLHSQRTNGYKYSGGASNSITRKPFNNFSSDRAPSKIFHTNISIPYIGLINTELFFFPERIIVKRDNQFAAVMYKNVECISMLTKFIEEEGVPSDSRVVGSTWKYLNKNGSPDKRFKNNRQLPICEYSEYHIESQSGIKEVIATSKAGCLDRFFYHITAIGALQKQMPIQKNQVQ